MRLLSRFTREDYDSQEDFENHYRLNIPENFNFARDVVDEYARIAPMQRAMLYVNDAGEEKTFTFLDIRQGSIRAANALLKLGIRPGDPVLLMLKRRYEYWMIALGLMRIGAIQIPATHQLQKKDIVYRIQASSAKMVICVGEDETCAHVSGAAAECPDLIGAACLGGRREGFIDFDAEMAAASLDEPNYPSPEGIMLMYFTSGTTGFPKMVAHDFNYPLGHTITGAFWHNLDDTSLHLTVADTGWAKCGWGKFYGQWVAGACLFVYDFDRFRADRMLSMLAKYRVTSFCAPPTVFRFLIKEDFSKYDLSALRWGNVAGEPLNPEVYSQFYKATGVKLREGFGQTEGTPFLLTTKWMEPHPGSVGVPSPHYRIRLLDEDGRDVEAGEEGEICVDLSQGKPAGLLMGYYRDPEHTAEAFAGGVYHTGDMAWRDEDGYYWFIGRADDVIKSSGYRIGPFEVESALLEHPAVLECAIIGVPDPDRGQVVKASVLLAKGYTPSDELRKELQNHVKKVTAPYKYPRILEFVDELPRTFSGKLQRKKLREENAKR